MDWPTETGKKSKNKFCFYENIQCDLLSILEKKQIERGNYVMAELWFGDARVRKSATKDVPAVAVRKSLVLLSTWMRKRRVHRCIIAEMPAIRDYHGKTRHERKKINIFGMHFLYVAVKLCEMSMDLKWLASFFRNIGIKLCVRLARGGSHTNWEILRLYSFYHSI